MRARDLGGDVEAQPEALMIWSGRRAEERLEQALDRGGGDRARPRCSPTARTRRRPARGAHPTPAGPPHHASGRWPAGSTSSWAMRARSQSTGLVRAISASIARSGQAARSSATTCSRTGPSGSCGRAVQLQPAAEAAARKIQHVVDQPGHAIDAALDQVDHRSRLVAQRLSPQQPHSSFDRWPTDCADRGPAPR